MKLILGSSSPRRLELLASIGIIPYKVCSPNISEKTNKKELPNDYCKRIAQEKMDSFKNDFNNNIVITADTIAYCGRRLVDKTSDKKVAKDNLSLLSGRRHKVLSVICVRNHLNKIKTKSVVTSVQFKVLSKIDIDTYIQSMEWQDVAGSYRIQGFAESFIKSINGSYSNVVGLPLYETKNLLLSVGLKM